MIWLLALSILAQPEPDAVRVGFVGDVNFAGRIDPPGEVLAEARAVLSAPDITVANLEGLLLEHGAPGYGEARLDITMKPSYAAALVGSGIDLLGVANNHSWDAGANGVIEHLRHLAATDLEVLGAGESIASAYAATRRTTAAGCLSFVPATLKSNRPTRAGAHVATYGARGERPVSALYALIASERAAGCAPIVTIHWGREARPTPDARVVEVGHGLVDAGAALVVGHHPHVLQGVEWRGGSAIAWSLGNFVFRNRTPDKRMTGLLLARFEPDRDGGAPALTTLKLMPMTIDPRTFRPRPAIAKETREHLEVLTARSRSFGTEVSLTEGVLRFRPRSR